MALRSALLEGEPEVEAQNPGISQHGELKSGRGGWKASIFILGCEFCEKMTHSTLFLNLVVYLTTVIHQGAAQAAQTVTTWAGTSSISSFLGAFLADAYWGRYWTIGIVYFVYTCGMILFTLTAVLPSLRPTECRIEDGPCEVMSRWKMAFFYIALYIVGFGAGGSKACVSPYGAYQFECEGPAQMSSFFNWYYFARNVGALIASTLIVYIQENVSWGVGYGIPTITVLLATLLFFIGTPWYRNQRPGGSPVTRIAQVFMAAVSNWNVQVPEDEGLLYELPGEESAIQGSKKIPHSSEFRCLDKAAVQTLQSFDGSSSSMLCTVTQVEEVKILIRLLPVWVCTVIYFTAYVQMTSLFIEQGQRMDTRILGSSFKMPAASMILFNTLALILCIPLYDSVLVPIFRKCTGCKQGITQIQRMTIRIFLMTVSMLAAAVLEFRRLQVAAEFNLLDNSTDPVPINILWQLPQYFLIGVSELFACVGQIEFFYDQAPDAMRSMGSALTLGATALGNYLSSFLVGIISKVTRSADSAGWIPDNLNAGHLDYFFLLLGLLNVAGGLILAICSRRYRYKMSENT